MAAARAAAGRDRAVGRAVAGGLLPFRAWELGLGALLAVVPLQRVPGAAPVGLALIGAAVFGFDHATAFPGVAALLPCLGAAAVLIGAPGPTARALAVSPLRALGRWSYALYLWHWPVVVYFSFIWMRGPTLAEALVLGLLSIGLAAASYRLIEVPLRNVDLGPPRRVLERGLAASAAALVVGGSVWFGGYDPAEAPSASRQATAASIDDTVDGCPGMAAARDDVRVCGFGTPEAPPDVLLWGDSHAASLAVAMAAEGEAAGLTGRVVAKNVCPPLLGIRLEQVAAGHGCVAHNEAVFTWIARNRPARVALHARWPLYAEGSRTGDERGPQPKLVVAGSDGRVAMLDHALTATVDALEALEIEVVLIDSVPEGEFDVTSVWERTRRLGLPLPDGPARARIRTRNRRVAPVMATLGDRQGVSRVEPVRALCDEERCAVFGADGPLYGDSNHLTHAGARRVAPLLRPALGVETYSLVD